MQDCENLLNCEIIERYVDLLGMLDVTLETPPGQVKLYSPKTYKGNPVASTGFASQRGSQMPRNTG